MKAKKSFSQNFLTDQSVVDRIIEAAEIQSDETVLEVGPGRGMLTQALVGAGAQVIAVEADGDLIPILEKKFGDKITLVHQDILTYQLPTANYKLVANLPYNITSAVLKLFLTATHKPSRMVVMVQKEVADRMEARPGDMSLLSVVCQLYAEVSLVCDVNRTAFDPAPKVDSVVVQLDLNDVDGPQTESVIRLAKIGFASRRKQLHKNLSTMPEWSSEQVKQAIGALGLPETARAQELSVDDWQKLHEQLAKF